MKASIIIANNRPDGDELWERTRKTLAESKESWMEIIVVNNGLKGRGNPCRARNEGARQAKGKYFVFLDNDVEVKKGWLSEVLKYMDKHPKVGGGQLKLLRIGSNKYDSAGEKLTLGGFLVERAREAEDVGQFDTDEPIFSGKGAGLVVRRAIFNQVGGFAEDYEYYWEEPDLFWRVWKAGYEVRFLYMGTVWHAFGTTKKPVSRERAVQVTYLGCRNQLMTIWKNAVGWRLWWMLGSSLIAWVGLWVMMIVKGDLERAGAVSRAIKQVVKLKNGKVISREKDDGWWEKVVVRKGWNWYYGKAKAYLTGRGF